MDRYGNAIRFNHSTQNGYPYISIIDSLDREIIVQGEASENGHIMTITLPDQLVLRYCVETYDDDFGCLSSYTDPVGNTTHYGYTTVSTYMNAWSKVDGGANNKYFNLTTITHPSSVQTRFTYTEDQRNLGSQGLMNVYKLSSRQDIIEETAYNHLTYTYSPDDCSGYPAYSDPDSLPSAFTYSATVTDALGKTITAVFNDQHLNTSITITDGTNTRQKTLYEYNENKLPIKTTIQKYGSSGAALETVTLTEYDAKGNVTAQWSSLAEGDSSNAEYKTTYTYEPAYGLLLSQTYKTDANTTVSIQNTLDTSGKNIASTQVYVNSTLTQRTDYAYDGYGNLTSTKVYHDNMTSYDLTEYVYENGAYLTQEKHSGMVTAEGEAALSTPGQAAGIIATSYAYDSLGRLTSVTDGSGNTTGYAYDALGNVTLITNPDNSTVTYARDYANNTVTVTDENGNAVKYTYTSLGLEYETVDVASGKVISRKEYDAMSRLVKSTEYVYGSVTKYTYDLFDRVTSETVYQDTAVLAQTLYAYDDSVNGCSKVTKTVVGDSSAPSIVTTEYTDKHGLVVKTGKMLDGVEYFDTYTYDYAGNVLSQLTAGDAAKGLSFTAKHEYNENGQVVKTYNAENLFTTNTYNSRGQLVTATDYAGTPTTYTYDALGRLLSQTITIEEGVTATSKYEYDANGNIIREWKPGNAVGEEETWEETEYAYDSRGNLTCVTQYDGEAAASVTRYTYDGVGNMLSMTAGSSTTSYTYDRFGNVLTTTDALGQTETNICSVLGRLESVTDRNGNTTSYTYDAAGRVLSETVSVGGELDIVSYTYTQSGQLHTEKNRWQLTTYTYDELGRSITVTENELKEYCRIPLFLDANGGEVSIHVLDAADYETFELPTPVRTGYIFEGWYNGDTLVSNGDPMNLTEGTTLVARWTANTYTIVYNANGGTIPSTALNLELRQKCVYDQEVTLKQNMFDAPVLKAFNGWSTKSTGLKMYSGGEVVKNLTSESNGVVNLYAVWKQPDAIIDPIKPAPFPIEIMSLSLAVEEQSETTEETTQLGYVKTYTYDLNDQLTSREIRLDGESVQAVNYGYDALNRLVTVTEGGALSATYTYDANGNRASLTYANGNVTTYSYNKANWVTRLSNENGETVVSSYDYTYYASGSQKTETNHTGRITSYTYDGLGRLTQESETGGATYSYSYDANGNRTQLAVTGSETYTTSYTYDANNRLTQESKSDGAVVEISVYTYDANGNLLSQTTTSSASTDAATLSYTYNGFDHQVTGNVNGTTTSYTYNAQGIRTSKTTGSSTTRYLLNGGNVVGEVTDGTLTATYLRGVNLISRTAGETEQYYLHNAHGDVVNLTDTAGAAVKSYDYDAFGNERNPDESDTNPFRYCGEYYDTETGTYYLRARYYDPEIGRFTQENPYWSVANMIYGDNPQKINEREDALGLKSYSYAPQILSIIQAGNLYVYCVNDPVSYRDVTGYVVTAALPSVKQDLLDPISGAGGGGGAIVGVGIIGAVVKTVVDTADDVITWVAGTFEEVKDKVADSFSKAVAREYRTNKELHHIVAQHAPEAESARWVLEQVGLSVSASENLVLIKTSLHRRLHSSLYYGWVNTLITDAYYSAPNDPVQQKDCVIKTLNELAVYIKALEALTLF